MEDLGEPNESFNTEFRFVEGPRFPLDDTASLAPKQSVPSNVRLLAISSRFGYAFVAAQNSISIFLLSALHGGASEATPAPVSTTVLNSDEYILALDLAMQDRCLLLHTRNSPDAISGRLLALDVPKLVAGTSTRLPWVDNHPCVTFTLFDDPNAPLLALITPEKSVKMLELPTGTARVLWSNSTGSLDSQAPVSLGFARNGLELAVGTRRGSVQLFNARDGSLRGTVKEVESGWIPGSVAYVAKNHLLVGYQNHDRLNHVVWRIQDGNVLGQSVLGDVFYPDIDAVEREVHLYCTPIKGWDLVILVNSSSEDVKVIAPSDDGWLLWSLEDGCETAFMVDGNPVFPIGFGIDYTDVRQVPLSGKPPRTPMPRFISLTSDGQLWSAWIVDDREGVTCEFVKEPLSISEAESFPVSHSAQISGTFFAPDPVLCGESELSEPKSVSSASDSGTDETVDVEVDVTVQPSAAPNLLAADSLGAASIFGAMNTESFFPKPSPSPSGFVFPASKNTQSPFASSFSNFNPDSMVREDPPSTFMKSDQSNKFQSNFQFDETSIGATESESEVLSSRDVAQDEEQDESPDVPQDAFQVETPTTVSREVTAPDMAESIALAENDDPVHQLKSILTGMEKEIAHVRAQKDVTLEAVENSRAHLDDNLTSFGSALKNLIELDYECWANEKQIRSELDVQLRSVIENGQSFEALNLLYTLLAENDDARPLHPDVQEMDRRLNTQEGHIRDRLNEVERKIEERIPEMDKKQKKKQWNSQAEVTQHIYSSLSLQGLRIKRARAMLDSLSAQVESSVEEEEIRVANSGLSRVRLERLAQSTSPGHSMGGTPSSTRPTLGTPFSSRAPVGTPAYNSVAKPLSKSGQRSSIDSLQWSVQKMNIRNSNAGSLGLSRYELDIAESEPETLLPESAAILRRLAMRKGRERITVSEKLPRSGVEGSTRRQRSSNRQEPKSNSSISNGLPNQPTRERPSALQDSAQSFPAPFQSAGSRLSFANSTTKSQDVSSKQRPASTTSKSLFGTEAPSKTIGLTLTDSPQNRGFSDTFTGSSILKASTKLDGLAPSPSKSAKRKSPGSSVQFTLPTEPSLADSPPGAEIASTAPSKLSIPARLSQGSNQGKSSKPGLKPEFAALPPDPTSPAVLSKSEPEFAALPPDPTFPVFSTHAKPEFAALPPDPTVPVKKHVESKPAPEFAALPPDPTPVVEKKAEPKARPEFGALPPDPTVTVTKKSEPKTVPQFAALPPDPIDGTPKQPQFAALLPDPVPLPPVSLENVKSTTVTSTATANLGTALPSSPPPTEGQSNEAGSKTEAPVSKSFSDARKMEASSSSEDEGISNLSVSQPSSASMFGSGSSKLVFGASSGGSLFGHTFGSSSSSSSTSTAFQFGSSTVAGLFGQSASTANAASSAGFQMTAASTGFGFGSGAQSGGFSGFGSSSFSSAQPTPAASSVATFSFSGATSTFGQPSTFGNSGGFGMSTGSTLGARPTATFGATSTFGAASSTSMFGTPSAFGANSTPGFGTPSALGASSGPAFGAPSTLGATSAPAFGTPSALGGSSAPVFGAPSAFGANASPSGFGSGFGGMQSSAPLFGGSSNSGGGFGSVTPQGTPQSKGSPFAQLSNNNTGFGSGFNSGGGSGFDTPNSQQGGFGGGGFGSGGGGVSGFGQIAQGGGGFGQAASGGGFGQVAGSGGGFGGFGQSQSQPNQFNSEAFRKRRS